MLFDLLFGKKKETEPHIIFGRYSDAYKTDAQYASWDKAVKLFDEQQYIDAYLAFFDYLRDEKENNVSFKQHGDSIEFEIIQGSKKITGVASNKKVVAETHVAKFDKLSVSFMRKLMEMNYRLQYSRYAFSPENTICLKFDTSVIDGSPDKLYFVLKEIGTHADKQDDLMIDEFSALQAVDNSHIVPATDSEKAIKYQFMQQWIKETLNRVNSLDKSTFSDNISYSLTLLNLVYKIDYLISPEGKLMDKLEKIHKTYFTQHDASLLEKNTKMKRGFEEILQLSQAEVSKELYHVTATFGITTPTTPIQISALITEEAKNIPTSKEEKNTPLALNVVEYIVQHAMFYYGMPHPTKKLFHFLVTIINADYFKALGFSQTYYDIDTKKFDKKAIRRKLSEIETAAKKRYINFRINANKLKYGSQFDFAHTLLLHLAELDYTIKQ